MGQESGIIFWIIQLYLLNIQYNLLNIQHNLKIWEVKYLRNHWSDLTQIKNLS
jgi:hypothetical protein